MSSYTNLFRPARSKTPRMNSYSVRYGIGSPYQLTEPQRVPVRPLTLRLTFDAAF